MLIVLLQIVGVGKPQEIHIFFRMKASQLVKTGRLGSLKNKLIRVIKYSAYVNFQMSINAVIKQQMMRHPDAIRLHHVALAVIIIADVTCKKLMETHFYLLC